MSWATEAELTTAADWYNIEILVTRNRQFTEWIKFAGEEIDRCTLSICMHLLLENNHFSLLYTVQTAQDQLQYSNQETTAEQCTHKKSRFDRYEVTDNS